jgi:hypothetical protein
MQYRREPRTLVTQLDASTSPRGLAVNPIQVGFHQIKRKWLPIPFTAGRKNINFVNRRPFVGSLDYFYLVEKAGFTSVKDSSR